MSIEAVFTNNTISNSWATSNQSDSWAGATADGGSITRELGDPTSQSQNTVVATVSGIQKFHMGTWVTTGAGEAFSIPSGATFALGNIFGYESAGTLNAYVYVKISRVYEDGNTDLVFDSTPIVDWTALRYDGSVEELGINTGSAYPLGGAVTAEGISTHAPTTATWNLVAGDRIAIEVGIDVTANKSGTVGIEYGCHLDMIDDATTQSGNGTGPFGSSVGLPVNFSQTYQDDWGAHAEIDIPWINTAESIAWADIGTDWSTTKWSNAARYVSRLGGTITAQFWIKQDNNYLYLAMNNIIDGCIQSSDHHSVFLCLGNDWKSDLLTDTTDYLFRRDITSGGSDTRSPTLPVAALDGNDAGEYILKGGDSGSTYPYYYEVPTYTAGTKTFTFTGSEDWVEGTDFRMKGPGATSTAPNPNNGGNSGGSYSEFKLLKSKLNSWNGTSPIGFMVSVQCDVQGNGNTIWPRILGNQVDVLDWNLPGINYLSTDGNTASSKTDAAEQDLRPIMGMHAHSQGAPTTNWVSINSITEANISSINGVARANIDSFNGIA